MIELASCQSISVEDMRNFLIRLPSTSYMPKLFYDAKFAEVKGEQEGDFTDEKANWLAELTVQHRGSAYEGYRSVTDLPIHKVVMYVQARHNDFLIVGHQVDPEKRIIHPAKLSLQDLIGYREIEKVE